MEKLETDMRTHIGNVGQQGEMVKKNIWLIAIFLIVSVSSCKDKNIEYFDNGQVKSVCEFQGGKLNGECKHYYKDGTLKSVTHYDEDKLNGRKEVYFPNGKLHLIVHYKNDQREGDYVEFNEQGDTIANVQYKNGLQHGLSTFYYDNSRVKTQQIFQRGKKSGDFHHYFPNGQLQLYSVMEDSVSVYYKKYNESGDLIDYYRFFDVTSANDTVNVHDTIKFIIDVEGPISGSEHIQLLDHSAKNLEKNQTYDKVELNEYGMGEYFITPKKIGSHDLHVILVEDTMSFDKWINFHVTE